MSLKNVTGKIKKCGSYKLPNPVPNKFEPGETWTHRLAIQMDDNNWYGFGNTDKEDFIVRDPETGDWAVLGAGSEVLIQYTLSDDGKYRNAKKGNLTVLNLNKGVPFKERLNSNISSDSGGNSNFDPTGMKVGHAINAAMLLGNNKYKKPTDIIEVAKKLHDVSAEVEQKYKELNPNLSMRDIGAASGHAVLNACKLKASTKPLDKVADIYKTAMALLVNVVPVMTAYVKGDATEGQEGQEKTTKEETTQKRETKTASKTKAKPVQEPEPEPPTQMEEADDEPPAGFEDLDDFDSMDEDVEF